MIPDLGNLVSRLSEWFDITVFTGSFGGTEPIEFLCGKARVIPVSAPARSSFPRMLRSVWSAFRKEHRKRPFQLLHGIWAYPGGTTAALLSSVYGIPFLVSVRGGESASVPAISYGLLLHPVLRRVTLSTCRRANALVVLTRYQATNLTRAGLEREDVHVIPAGAPSDWIADPKPKRPAPPYRILHVANLTEVKDQETLLRAFAAIRKSVDARLRIIGSDHLGGKIQALARALGIDAHVQFIDHIPHSQLKQHYEWAHVMLHTSLYEGQGVVLAEAAASGVAVCGTAVGLIADLGESCMKSCQPRDHVCLSAKTISLLKNQEEFANLTGNARSWASGHTGDRAAESYRRLYETTAEVEKQ
jgi:glycosyltransferase involved in cell wall biosynthesis